MSTIRFDRSAALVAARAAFYSVADRMRFSFDVAGDAVHAALDEYEHQTDAKDGEAVGVDHEQELRGHLMAKTHECLDWKNEAWALGEQKKREEELHAKLQKRSHERAVAAEKDAREARERAEKAEQERDRLRAELAADREWHSVALERAERAEENTQAAIEARVERDTLRAQLAELRAGVVRLAKAWNDDPCGDGPDELLALLSPSTPVAPAQERPAVGSVCSWDVAREDMEAHAGAQWTPTGDFTWYRMSCGELQYRIPQIPQWVESCLTETGGYSWTRLPDADAPAPAQDSEADGLAERVAQLERIVRELCEIGGCTWLERRQRALALLSAEAGAR